jgi:deazaflavin-dependent oxidoreductase (nitroreductase family)
MSDRPYLKPPWMQRHVGNRLAPLFQPSVISKLSVPGRRTGRWHTVPVAVLDYQGERYLVSYRGESDWARNLRASLRARLRTRDDVEEIAVAEVPVAERPPIMESYTARYSKFPTVGSVLRALPDPADHPIFRIVPSGASSDDGPTAGATPRGTG